MREIQEKQEWRLIPLKENNAFMNMAIDEAILNHVVKKKSPNTLRFYRWNPSAVSIGFFQNVYEEVNIELCKKLKIDVVRRITGGGAVFHDYNGEITYSIIYNENNPEIPKEISKAYFFTCKGIINALKRKGWKAIFQTGKIHSCPNIELQGYKISGNARTRKHSVVLQHGTILLKVRPEVMFNVLKKPVPGVENHEKAFQIASKKVKGVNDIVEDKLSFEELYEALVSGFEEALNVNFRTGNLEKSELKEAEKLAVKKYMTKKWLVNRKESK